MKVLTPTEFKSSSNAVQCAMWPLAKLWLSRMPHAQFSSLSARISRIQFAHPVSGIVIFWTFCTWSSCLYLVSFQQKTSEVWAVSIVPSASTKAVRKHMTWQLQLLWDQRNCGQESRARKMRHANRKIASNRCKRETRSRKKIISTSTSTTVAWIRCFKVDPAPVEP